MLLKKTDSNLHAKILTLKLLMGDSNIDQMESASNLWPQWNNGEGYKINEFLDISYKFRISPGLEADF